MRVEFGPSRLTHTEGLDDAPVWRFNHEEWLELPEPLPPYWDLPIPDGDPVAGTDRQRYERIKVLPWPWSDKSRFVYTYKATLPDRGALNP